MAPALIQEVEDDSAPPRPLELTPVESTLRHLLLDVADYIDDSPTPADTGTTVQLPTQLAKEKIVLRFTGGWVRDKLLGVPSHDIDVAINKMTGYAFGLRLKEYLDIPGNPEKYGLEGVATTANQSAKAGATDKSKTVGGLHKIEANPEKSKHLETVTTRILGLDIDLVNLRKETYTEDSRNPQMEFGTPEEDAMRRDATVNAMFYNLNTEEVEDFTGQGHDDMKAKVICTPLEPYQTFKDDPLRVLRLIRFASRLGYEIDPKALNAMKDPEIKDALRRKISRERIGVEIEKCLRGPDPHEALRLIFELGLYQTVFSDPTVELQDTFTPDIDGWRSFIGYLCTALELEDDILSTTLLRDPEDRFLAWQLTALVPYNDAPQPEPPEPGRKAPPPIAAAVAREGIKSTNKVCDIVTAAVRNQPEISALVDKLCLQHRRPDKKLDGEDASARDVLGMAIRRWGATWRSQVVYAMVVDVARDSGAADAIERKYSAFVKHLQTLDILEAYNFKPLMDGKALAKALNTPPGPWMKDALDVVMAYQLRHPDTASAKGAIAEIHQQQSENSGELTHSLISHFLSLTIRPLFLKTKPSAVTDTGRKNTTTVLPPKMTMESMDERVAKPWKDAKDAYALDLLRWCVSALDEASIEGMWHLLLPPLLTLVDDGETQYKTSGVEMAWRVLQVTPPALLAKTGLGDVFADALMPCLTSLPPITPREESLSLLDVAYPTLLTLANVRYSQSPRAGAKQPAEELASAKTKFLDKVVRKGVIFGYNHCSNDNDNVRIISLLFNHLGPFLSALGIEAVKHLKYILPMLTETLSRPVAGAADMPVETLRSATRCLLAVVLTCWPRMVEWRGEVLRSVVFGWLAVVDLEAEGDAGQEVEGLREELKECVRVLGCAVVQVGGEKVDWRRECEMLVEVEPRVNRLLLLDD